jgi:hypothetical protein
VGGFGEVGADGAVSMRLWEVHTEDRDPLETRFVAGSAVTEAIDRLDGAPRPPADARPYD